MSPQVPYFAPGDFRDAFCVAVRVPLDAPAMDSSVVSVNTANQACFSSADFLTQWYQDNCNCVKHVQISQLLSRVQDRIISWKFNL